MVFDENLSAYTVFGPKVRFIYSTSTFKFSLFICQYIVELLILYVL